MYGITGLNKLLFQHNHHVSVLSIVLSGVYFSGESTQPQVMLSLLLTIDKAKREPSQNIPGRLVFCTTIIHRGIRPNKTIPDERNGYLAIFQIVNKG